jgi:hypothetical protein
VGEATKDEAFALGTADSGSQARRSFELYDVYASVSMIYLGLESMCPDLTTMATQFRLYQRISTWPSLTALKTMGMRQGRSGAKAHLQGMDGQPLITVALPHDEGGGEVTDRWSAVKVIYAFIQMLAAALCIEIPADAYGGGEEGKMLLPGRQGVVRMGITPTAVNLLLTRCLGLEAPTGKALLHRVDGVAKEFMKKLNYRNLHPDAIVRDLHEMRPDLWGATAQSEPAARSAYSPKVGGRGGGEAAVGVCHYWLHGGCKKLPNCDFGHPKALKGATSFRASPSGKGSGGKKDGGPGKRGKASAESAVADP